MKEPYVKPQIYRIKLDPVQTKFVENPCCSVGYYAKFTGGAHPGCGTPPCGSNELSLNGPSSS